jgi:hypothetical protein
MITNFKSIKVSLKYILKYPDINLPKISLTVSMAHKIVIHTLQFIKLYSLSYYEQHQLLPLIDKSFINCCMKILCTKTETHGRPPKDKTKNLKQQLTEFYIQHYQQLCSNDPLNYTYMGNILNYLTTDILTTAKLYTLQGV